MQGDAREACGAALPNVQVRLEAVFERGSAAPIFLFLAPFLRNCVHRPITMFEKPGETFRVQPVEQWHGLLIGIQYRRKIMRNKNDISDDIDLFSLV